MTGVPVDPDPGGPTARLRWDEIGLVFAGGAVGTLARCGAGLLVPVAGSFPVATFAVNIVGAFALGWLVADLAARGDDTGRRRRLRLFLGTGVLGGFTTYSALALESALLATSLVAVGYGLSTVLVGAAASLAGIALGGRHAR